MKWYFLVILITFLALTLRLYRISDYPISPYVDEVAIGYNAHSIVETGRDEWGNLFPTSFRSFGDFKLPLYVYLVAAFELVVGKSPLAIRLPSVLAGTATVLALMTLLPSLGARKKTALLSGFILAILPWHIHFSRAGFEATLGLFLTTWGILLLIKHITHNSSPITYNLQPITSFLLLVFSLYSYHAQRIITPLLVLVVMILYKHYISRETLRRMLLPSFICIILLVPYIRYMTQASGIARASSESFLTDVRGRPNNLFSQKPILAAEQFLGGYLKNFSPTVLFFTGDGNGRHGVRELGQLYLWMLPFLVIGVIRAIGEIREKKKNQNISLLMLAWLFIAPLPAALVRPNPHALRTLPMVIPLVYWIATGLQRAGDTISKVKSEYQNPKYETNSNDKNSNVQNSFDHLVIRISKIVSDFVLRISSLFGIQFLLLLPISYFLFSYLHIYFVHYPKRSEPDWNGGYDRVVSYVLEHQKDFREVWITHDFVQGYIFFAYYGDILPSDFQMSNYRTTDRLGNIVFLATKLPDTFEKGVLYIAPHGSFAPGKFITVIHDKSNNPIFDIWEN